MTHFHAVMLDETGCEFGAGVEAPDRETAYDKLRDDYPESSIVQLESPDDTRRREADLYARALQDELEEDEGEEWCELCDAPLMADGFCPEGCDH